MMDAPGVFRSLFLNAPRWPCTLTSFHAAEYKRPMTLLGTSSDGSLHFVARFKGGPYVIINESHRVHVRGMFYDVCENIPLGRFNVHDVHLLRQ